MTSSPPSFARLSRASSLFRPSPGAPRRSPTESRRIPDRREFARTAYQGPSRTPAPAPLRRSRKGVIAGLSTTSPTRADGERREGSMGNGIARIGSERRRIDRDVETRRVVRAERKLEAGVIQPASRSASRSAAASARVSVSAISPAPAFAQEAAIAEPTPPAPTMRTRLARDVAAGARRRREQSLRRRTCRRSACRPPFRRTALQAPATRTAVDASSSQSTTATLCGMVMRAP